MLKVYKTHESAYMPFYGTAQAACFDLSASLVPGSKVIYYTTSNQKVQTTINSTRTLKLLPRCRYLIPTNLIFDIPEGFSVRLHPRSGWSLKQGVTLVNCEGVIDSDYIDPIFVAAVNTGNYETEIEDGFRVAQGELVRDERAEIVQIDEAPRAKSDREGGFGSTGQ